MSDKTYHTTKEQIRKAESKESARHGGTVPPDSDVSQMKSVIDSETNKEADIERRKEKLPLPEDPPVESDFRSADSRPVNVGSGRFSGPAAGTGDESSDLRGPATADSSARTDAEEWKTHTAP